MKDVKGAEYAMKLAKDIWEQPPAITQRSPARLHQTSSRGPILSLPVGKGMVATSYSQSRPNSSGPPMLSAVFSPISGTLVTPSTQPFKTIKSLGSGSDLPAISRTDVPQLNVVKSTSDVATPQIIVGESTKLQTERNVDVKIEDTSVVASDSHPRADSNVEVKIEDRSVVASHPPSRTDPNAQVEIKDTSVVASHPPSRTDPNAQVKIKDTSIVASQTQSRGVRRLLIESDDFSLQKKRKTTDLRLGDVEDLVSVYFGSKNLPQSQTTLVRVFNFLSKTELYQASLVCKDWSNLATDDSLGKSSKTRNITLHEHDKT